MYYQVSNFLDNWIVCLFVLFMLWTVFFLIFIKWKVVIHYWGNKKMVKRTLIWNHFKILKSLLMLYDGSKFFDGAVL